MNDMSWPAARAQRQSGGVDSAALSAAYEELLDAARGMAAQRAVDPPPGEWTAEQVLGHVVLVNAATIEAVCSVLARSLRTYDNRLSQDEWTIGRVVEQIGDLEALCVRISQQAEALTSLAVGLTAGELSTCIPTVLLSNGALLVDDLLPLAGLLEGLITTELPGHAAQLRSLYEPPADD